MKEPRFFIKPEKKPVNTLGCNWNIYNPKKEPKDGEEILLLGPKGQLELVCIIRPHTFSKNNGTIIDTEDARKGTAFYPYEFLWKKETRLKGWKWKYLRPFLPKSFQKI